MTDSPLDFQSLLRTGIIKNRPYSPGKPVCEVQRELGIDSVIKLASNENPEQPIRAVLDAIAAAATGINRYPDAASYHVTKRLAAHLKVTPKSLLLGNGSNEVLDILIRALISPGENVVFSEHSFIVYALSARVHFECGVAVPLQAGDRHDLPAMAAAVNDSTKLVIICNPNNPTGTYVTSAELEKFLAEIPRHVIVAVDEAYFEYVTANDYPQTISLREAHPNLVILRTFSKIHSLAGLRLGYAVGHPDLVSELHKTREPFNVNMLSQAAAIACLDNWDEVAARRDRNRQQMTWLIAELKKLDLEAVPSQTNFILVRGKVNAGKLSDDLLQTGVIVRPMHAFGLGDGALRISIGLPEENQRCVDALKEILN